MRERQRKKLPFVIVDADLAFSFLLFSGAHQKLAAKICICGASWIRKFPHDFLSYAIMLNITSDFDCILPNSRHISQRILHRSIVCCVWVFEWQIFKLWWHRWQNNLMISACRADSHIYPTNLMIMMMAQMHASTNHLAW